MTLWSTTSHRCQAILRGHRSIVQGLARIPSLAFSPDGKTLVSGSKTGVVQLWDVASLELRKSITGPTLSVYRAQERTILKGGVEVAAIIPDKVAPVDESIPVQAVAFSPDGKALAVGYTAFERPGQITLLDPATGREIRTLIQPKDGYNSASLYALAFSPDGRMLATGLYTGVAIWDVEKGHLQGMLTRPTPGPVRGWPSLPTVHRWPTAPTSSSSSGNSATGPRPVWHPEGSGLQIVERDHREAATSPPVTVTPTTMNVDEPREESIHNERVIMSTNQSGRTRIFLVGAGGTLGRAVAAELGTRHHIIAAGRNSGDIRLDLSDAASIRNALAKAGRLDAVVCTAGEVAFAPLSAIHPGGIGESAYTLGLTNKLLGQVNLALAVASTWPKAARSP